MAARLWKVLSIDRGSLVSGTEFTYPAKAWTRHLKPDKLALCEWGYHYCEGKQVLDWLREGLLCEVERCAKHKPLRDDSKCVSCRLRIVRSFPLDARVLRLLICDCAERALLRERKLGREPAAVLWEAVRVARLFAEGEATKGELAAAHNAATYTAYATNAAYNATYVAYVAYNAAYAAYNAAYAAAAYNAYAAERTWQYRRLLKLVGA